MAAQTEFSEIYLYLYPSVCLSVYLHVCVQKVSSEVGSWVDLVGTGGRNEGERYQDTLYAYIKL